MNKPFQPRLLVKALSEVPLDSQLDLLREVLLTTLDTVESIKASYLQQSDHRLQLDEAMRQFEATLLHRALVISHGNRALAARLLGVKVTTFHAKLKRHNIHYDASVTTDPISRKNH